MVVVAVVVCLGSSAKKVAFHPLGKMLGLVLGCVACGLFAHDWVICVKGMVLRACPRHLVHHI